MLILIGLFFLHKIIIYGIYIENVFEIVVTTSNHIYEIANAYWPLGVVNLVVQLFIIYLCWYFHSSLQYLVS